jgi:AmiR/NasT family two-component response regulator
MTQTETDHPVPTTGDVDAVALSAEPGRDVQRELARAKDTIENLEAALRTSREIGMAIGIIMARRYVSAQSAWQLLVAASQQRQRKLREIASEVVYIGMLES